MTSLPLDVACRQPSDVGPGACAVADVHPLTAPAQDLARVLLPADGHADRNGLGRCCVRREAAVDRLLRHPLMVHAAARPGR